MSEMPSGIVESNVNGCDAVRRYILTKYRCGEKLPRIGELSKKAGVSRYAAERVLTEMSAEGIVERKPRFGSVLMRNESNSYSTNVHSKIKTLAFIADDLRSFIAGEYMLGIESRCRGKEILVSPLNSDYQPSIEKHNLRSLSNGHFCGAIIRFGEQSENIQMLDKEVSNGFPVVLVDRGDEGTGFPCVKMNQRKAGYDATKHLIDLGHSRIAHITYNENLRPLLAETKARKEGYFDALNQAGIGVPPGYVGGGDLFAQGERPTQSYFCSLGYEPMNRLLLQKVRPTAVFLMNFQFVFGVLRAIKDHGLTVPGDISVICIDDEPLALHLDPSITVISQPLQKMGYLAVDILTETISGRKPSQLCYELEGKLILRGSTTILNKHND